MSSLSDLQREREGEGEKPVWAASLQALEPPKLAHLNLREQQLYTEALSHR